MINKIFVRLSLMQNIYFKISIFRTCLRSKYCDQNNENQVFFHLEEKLIKKSKFEIKIQFLIVNFENLII